MSESVDHEEKQTPTFGQQQLDMVIDQIFESEGGLLTDCGDSSSQFLSLNDEEALRLKYEKYLMKELRGAIRQLAKERIEREALLRQMDQTTVEEVAKRTELLIKGRDIRALVSGDVTLEDSEELLDEMPNTCREKPQLPTQHYHKDELDQSDNDSELAVEFKNIAQLVASRFKNQHDETFGSDTESDLET